MGISQSWRVVCWENQTTVAVLFCRYDPKGLQKAFKSMGYDGCDIIQEANTILPIFHDGGYGEEIHEMSEMAINCWGQWELDNQPVWILQHMQVCTHSCCLPLDAGATAVPLMRFCDCCPGCFRRQRNWEMRRPGPEMASRVELDAASRCRHVSWRRRQRQYGRMVCDEHAWFLP